MPVPRTFFVLKVLCVVVFAWTNQRPQTHAAPAADTPVEVKENEIGETESTQSNLVTAADLARYQTILGDLRILVEKNNEVSTKFYLNGREESYDWQDQWEQNLIDIEASLAEFRSLACRIYCSDLEQPTGLDAMIESVTDDMVKRGQYLHVASPLEKFLSSRPNDQNLKLKLGFVYLKTNRFEEAMKLLIQVAPERFKSISDTEKMLLANLPPLIESFAREQTIRQLEKEADDLPRVEIVTNRGAIVLELFENEAPQTVANFIALVESGHYDGTMFHRVIEDFVAQGGGITEDGHPRPIGYTINDEFTREDVRHHFRGSVSLANTGSPNSGGAEFFINFAPAPFLDGKHTVFGRAIEGEFVWQRITRTFSPEQTEDGQSPAIDDAIPDIIVSARVLRKRPHEYTPTKR